MPRFHLVTSGNVADVLVDTDVFIDHLRGAKELKAGRHRLHYSVITRAELFAGTAATGVVTQLLGPLRELPVDRAIAEAAGRVRREAGIRLPDALIAATALEHKLEVATRNTRDFDQVRGLRLRQLG
jgi:predicted nucleic acid-binding protein